MNTFPFSDRTVTNVDEWFDVKSQSGLLVTIFFDTMTS
jgi:hypothetical protein